jgi:hypothetical protein
MAPILEDHMWVALLLGVALAPGQISPGANAAPQPANVAPVANAPAANGKDSSGKASDAKKAEAKKEDKKCNGKEEPQPYHFLARFIKAYRDEFCKSEDGDDKDGNDSDGKKDGNGSDSKDGNGSDAKSGHGPDAKSGNNSNAKNGSGSGSDSKNGNGPDGKNGDDKSKSKEPERRALPSPMPSPPFPTPEWQGFPLIGVPVSTTQYPLTKALWGGGPGGLWLEENRIKVYGWLNGSVNVSSSRHSNTPSSYWIDPNNAMLNQEVIRFEREVDTVQTDHLDWGFRVTYDYGSDYRYFTAGGWFSDQLLVHNFLTGSDLTEVYAHLYVPWVAQGLLVTVGRWIATPDIETQFAPDNYLGTHSLLFTIDVYTETGIMGTVMLDKQWTVQAALHAGADMAPWYPGAQPTGMAGVRWVSEDNNDSVYTVLNAINNAHFQYFTVRGQPAGHHNYNIIQSTWQHKFSDDVITKTEAYYMWEYNAAVGGTPSLGPFKFNSGGGLGPTVPGLSSTCAILNYTMFRLTEKKDFLTVRNEYTYDEHGTRYGFKGSYTSNTIGLTHHFNSLLTVRPEIGYYRSYDAKAFDNGTRRNMLLAGFDVILRF